METVTECGMLNADCGIKDIKQLSRGLTRIKIYREGAPDKGSPMKAFEDKIRGQAPYVECYLDSR